MRHPISQTLNWVGNFLSHRQRRFILDRLGGGRIVTWLAKGRYGELTLPNGDVITINPLLHGHLGTGEGLAYEEDVLSVIHNNLHPGDVFYDVGANVGVFSFIAATLVGEKGAVLAFEPEENNLVCFRRSLKRAKAEIITLYDFALGAADGEMVFDRRGGAFSGRLVDAGETGVGSAVKVKVRSIDSLIDEGAAAPTLLKIDVEGGEGAVLEGARRTLKTHRPAILCEMHGFNPAGVKRAVECLANAGYLLHALDGKPVSVAHPGGHIPRHILATPGEPTS